MLKCNLVKFERNFSRRDTYEDIQHHDPQKGGAGAALSLIHIFMELASSSSFSLSKLLRGWDEFVSMRFTSVSYTHLDVYKRQVLTLGFSPLI